MRRRNFLKRFTGALGGLLFIPAQIFAEYTSSLTLHFKNETYKIPYIKKWRKIYFSLVDFADKLNYGIFTNKEKRKSVLYVGRDKVKFTANNSFVELNGALRQFTLQPIWKDGEIWVPAELMADLFTRYSAHKMTFNAAKTEFVIGKKNVNISQIAVSAKENGTLIHIYTERKFSKKDVALKVVNGWLYVEIFGAKVDTKTLANKMANGGIKEIRAVQFEQSASLAFRLRGKIASRDLMIDPENGDIYVTLRLPQAAKKEEKPTDHQKKELDEQKKDWLIHTIVIDAGHGGKDPGAIGYRGLKEKSVVLPVALKLGRELKKRLPDVKIVYTRKTDVFIPLWKRTKIANEHNGKLFVSLHCNSNRSSRARGFETYFLSADKDSKARDVVLKENESINFESQVDRKRYEGVNFVLATMAQNAFIKYSQYLATVVQKSLAKKLRVLEMKSRGVKQGPFWVMVGATMPNILIEMGFISNKYEAKLLKQKSTQTRIAQAITDGIVKYKTDVESAL